MHKHHLGYGNFKLLFISRTFFFYQHYVRNSIYTTDKKVTLVDLMVRSLEAHILSFHGVPRIFHETSLWDLSALWNPV